EKIKTLREVIELTVRAAHEQELFPPADWEFIQWLAETHADRRDGDETLVLSNLELLHWLARWGDSNRLEAQNSDAPAGTKTARQFQGQIPALPPHRENHTAELALSHRLTLPDGEIHPLSGVKFFSGKPPLALVGQEFFLLRNAPPATVLENLST